MTVVVELAGLEIPGRHGVEDRERENEQPFLYDVELTLAEPAVDDIEHTADYREVAALVREVSERRRFKLIESLAAAVADALLERFAAESVRVRVRKPDVRLGAPVAYTAATVERVSPRA
jgi:7,8-dihydroneopterin aldolase/epimerase/oxygenase